jgi:hypothetical protein
VVVQDSWVGLREYGVVQKPVHMHALVLALFASLVAPFGGFFASVRHSYSTHGVLAVEGRVGRRDGQGGGMGRRSAYC